MRAHFLIVYIVISHEYIDVDSVEYVRVMCR